MPEQPRLTAPEAEGLLLSSGFILIRTKGSHRIYMKKNMRIVPPYHSGVILHPKVIKQVYDAIEDAK